VSVVWLVALSCLLLDVQLCPFHQSSATCGHVPALITVT
jgi:hypothetical protein